MAEKIERLIVSSGLEWKLANALRWRAPQIRARDVVR